MGNCITAPFRRNYQNRSGTRAAGRGAAGGGARVGADGSTGGRGPVGSGPGFGWRGVGSTRAAGRARSALTPIAMGGAADSGVRGRDAGGEARRA